MKNLKKTAMLFAISLSYLLVAGCGSTEKQILTAIDLCKQHGGISILWGDLDSDDIDVKCKDGVRIEKNIKGN